MATVGLVLGLVGIAALCVWIAVTGARQRGSAEAESRVVRKGQEREKLAEIRLLRRRRGRDLLARLRRRRAGRPPAPPAPPE